MVDLFNAALQGAANAVIIAAGLAYLREAAARRRLEREQSAALERAMARARVPAARLDAAFKPFRPPAGPPE